MEQTSQTKFCNGWDFEPPLEPVACKFSTITPTPAKCPSCDYCLIGAHNICVFIKGITEKY